MGEFFHTFFNFSLMGDKFGGALDAFWMTTRIFLLSGVLSLAWGLVLGVLRQLPGRRAAPIRFLTIVYIDFFRGVPLLLIILLTSGGLGALSANGVIPKSLGVPQWFGMTDPFWYGTMAITLTYGAYMAEVYRAGIEAVPRGQMEAARSLGMSHGQAMRFIIVPQAIRKVIPPLLNDLIALMKDTSLVSVISLVELVKFSSDVYAETFSPSLYILAAGFYLILTIPLARLVDWMLKRQEQKFQRGMA